MKITRFILLLLFLGCVSCDMLRPVVINGQKECILPNECGIIKIRASSLEAFPPMYIACTFDGKYHVNTDSLKIEAVPNHVAVTNIVFRARNKNILKKRRIFTGNEIETKKDESLLIWFGIESATPFSWSEVIILLLPSNLITCEGKPIITDTIRIQLKN